MSNIPEMLKYTKTHEWVRVAEDGVLTVGITDHAQELLGDMVFVELPAIGATYSAGDDCVVVESVKAASDVCCPVSGDVTEANEVVTESPELINQQPYGDGWIFRICPADKGALGGLLTASDYAKLIASE